MENYMSLKDADNFINVNKAKIQSMIDQFSMELTKEYTPDSLGESVIENFAKIVNVEPADLISDVEMYAIFCWFVERNSPLQQFNTITFFNELVQTYITGSSRASMINRSLGMIKEESERREKLKMVHKEETICSISEEEATNRLSYLREYEQHIRETCMGYATEARKGMGAKHILKYADFLNEYIRFDFKGDSKNITEMSCCEMSKLETGIQHRLNVLALLIDSGYDLKNIKKSDFKLYTKMYSRYIKRGTF